MPYSNDDLYVLLGIVPEASDDELRRAYRKLAMIWHPDRNSSADAEETFKRIRYAYELLSDAERRADYDRTANDRAAAATSDVDNRRAPDLHRKVRISLREQIHGGRVKLKVTRTEYCGPCHGSGMAPTPPVPCPQCEGTGEVRRSLGLFAFFATERVTCAECAGQGTIQPICQVCDGSGIESRKTGYLRFAVPAGVVPGALLRVRGHGRRARPGEAAGDLRVTIELAAHPLFEVDFPNLTCDIPVSVFRAALGGTVRVPTLDGAAELALPAHINDGAELRIAAGGLLADGRRGDLIARLRLVYPSALTHQQRELLGQLDQSMADHPQFVDWAQRCKQATPATDHANS